MSVAKNTVFLTGASIIQKALSFVYFYVLARHFSTDIIGQYSYALAFTTLFAVIVDAGLTSVLIRAVAQDMQRAIALFRRTVWIKAFLAGVVAVIIGAVVYVTDEAFAVRNLIFVAMVVMFVDQLNLSLYGVLRGFQNLMFESCGMIAAQFVSFAVGIITVVWDLPITIAIIGLGLGSLINAMVAIVGLTRHTRELRTHGGEMPYRELAREAAPFAIAGICARGYSFLDTIILASLSFTAAGLYSVPNKITFAFQFIPLALSASLYPAFARMMGESAQLRALWHNAQRYLLLVGALIVAGLVSLSHDILVFYKPAYAAAQLPLIILAASLIFTYLSYPVGALLNAAGLQRLQTAAMALTLVINAALNLLLIRQFGPLGAAVAAFVGNFVLFATGAYFVQQRVTQLPWGALARDASRLLIIGAISGVSMWAAAHMVHWVMAGLIGTGIYAALLLATRTITRSDITDFKARLRSV